MAESMPSFGVSILPVRVRPPSMKNSCVYPSRMRNVRYFRNTIL